MTAQRKSGIDEAQFIRAVLKAAMTLASSEEALTREIARNILRERGVPGLAEEVASGDPGRHADTPAAKNRKLASQARHERPRLTVDPHTPVSIALYGVPRHGVFVAYGIIRLSDACSWRETELRALKGIGPRLIDALKAAMSRASLSLQSDE